MVRTTTLPKIKVALAHDFLREYGGAERVVEALHELFPQAPLYVAFADPKAMGLHWAKFRNWEIHQSWLSRVPGVHHFFSPLRILASRAFESFDLSEYDLVISSSNAYFAKAVRVRPDALHLCYCHTPPRSLYGFSTMSNWQQNPVTHVAGTLINHFCRVVDFRTAQRVKIFIANSREVQARIAKFYRRDSVVIYPPVNVGAASLRPATAGHRSAAQAANYYLYVNRLAFAKHPELAVQACSQLGVPLKVVGAGKMLEKLKALAGPTVELLGSVDDQKLNELYAGAKALLYPVEDEDFGIVPIEAMAHGVPVIAHRSGGPRETIIEGKTGLFFDDLTVEGMANAIKKFEKQAKSFRSAGLVKHAQKFSKERFKELILELISQNL
jgi:glycosyltransferase involved in cell wall biosynthesis